MPAISASTLGQLSQIQNLISLLVEGVSDPDCREQFHPDLAPLGWYLGRAAWLEAYWLRDRVLGEQGVVGPLEPLYGPAPLPVARRGSELPGRDDLLVWAQAWFDDTLMRLANPGLLPDHPLLEREYLVHYLVQHLALIYEEMLMVLTQRALRQPATEFPVAEPLRPARPAAATHEIPRGHYRVGGADNPRALDLELPPQAVELTAYRIAVRPVTNAEYLAFMEADGYAEPRWWSEAGRAWLQESGTQQPDSWRRNGRGEWFGIGLNGAYALAPEAPLQGVCRYEAEAFAAWAGHTVPELAGARLPHEYQWEAACRLGSLDDPWQVREWCANTLLPYAGFTPFPEGSPSPRLFEGDPGVLRGATLHAQPAVRRPSFRHPAAPQQRHGFSGLRLVLAPSDLPG